MKKTSFMSEHSRKHLWIVIKWALFTNLKILKFCISAPSLWITY
jgi:hypothetical protein